jgi:hypothetical protein
MVDNSTLAVGAIGLGAAWIASRRGAIDLPTPEVIVQRASGSSGNDSDSSSSGSSSSSEPVVSGFDDPDFDTAQEISAGVTVDAIDGGLVESVDAGDVTLDDASGYIGHTGL